jgi:hypothetical protein
MGKATGAAVGWVETAVLDSDEKSSGVLRDEKRPTMFGDHQANGS